MLKALGGLIKPKKEDDPSFLLKQLANSMKKKVELNQKLAKLLTGNLNDQMPKFMIYSKLDKNMLKCICLRFCDIEEEMIKDTKKLLLGKLNVKIDI